MGNPREGSSGLSYSLKTGSCSALASCARQGFFAWFAAASWRQTMRKNAVLQHRPLKYAENDILPDEIGDTAYKSIGQTIDEVDVEQSYNTDIIYLIQCSTPKREIISMATRALKQTVTFSDPPIAASLFNSTSWSLLWLVVRLYVGYQWLEAGLGKFNESGLGSHRCGPEGLLGQGSDDPGGSGPPSYYF